MKARQFIVLLTLILVVLAGFLASPLPVAAQEAPGAVPPDAAKSFGDIVSSLILWVQNATYVAGLAVGVTLITNAVKFICAKNNVKINPVLIWLSVQTLAWIGFSVASHFGFGLKFIQSWDAGVIILQQLLPLIGFGAVVSHGVYSFARNHEVGALGYSPNDSWRHSKT
jgi:hypothetical protein